MSTEKNETVKTSQIRIDVHLDKENLPINIEWDADDADFDGKESAKGMMLSIFDGLQQNAMRIDLWTKEMNVEEMNLFMFQTLATMADTFEKATGNKELSDEMRDFVHHFGHKANVFGPDHKH
ncbi:MAG: gliding motility protein GldC [Bacteroidia bacterium]|nr:gliding motility protein GldC [Bacteroidia bacterium]MCF8426694.1 gliding motility protein GldC [Bacteroidia bacterium]MCF8445966.1 gliding motility protein GldC [Bacteroidia bacterium]